MLPRIISRSNYMCGSKFDTQVISDIIDCSDGPLYGFVIIDGDHTLFATTKGNLGNEHITILNKFSSHIRGRTRRGGSSSARFDRLRDDAEDKYINRAVENSECFRDCDAIIIGGKANIKNVYGSRLVGFSILGYFNVSESLETGLYETIKKSKTIRDRFENRLEYESMELLNKQLVNDDNLLVFGIRETHKYVQMGMVDTIIISTRLKPKVIEGFGELSKQFGTKYLKIRGITGEGDSFCRDYKVVGILRYLI